MFELFKKSKISVKEREICLVHYEVNHYPHNYKFAASFIVTNRFMNKTNEPINVDYTKDTKSVRFDFFRHDLNFPGKLDSLTPPDRGKPFPLTLGENDIFDFVQTCRGPIHIYIHVRHDLLDYQLSPVDVKSGMLELQFQDDQDAMLFKLVFQ